jgi:DNA-binding response OmpR family regulator
MAGILAAEHRVVKALIADDDPGILKFLAGRCAKMGFEVQTAVNGLQALMMAGRDHPDVLIVDINMPEVDGLSVCLRMLHPDKKPVDVIVITASSYSDTAERCESFGAFHVRKGAHLWDGVKSALTQLFPNMTPWTAEEMPPSRVGTLQLPRVLVVDSDPEVGAFLTGRLRKHGVDTLVASDAVQGFRMACRDQPSVIITDNLTRSGDAQYLLWKLRSTADTWGIPVFVMTAGTLSEATKVVLARDYCGRPGAAQFFVKSLDPSELLAALQKFCAFQSDPSEPSGAPAT